MDVFFYETFKEEAEELSRLLGDDVKFEFTSATIQESGHTVAPASFISIRTQSRIPVEWASHLDGILSRSTGYDHLIAYQRQAGTKILLGYLEEYATRAVAEHAIMLVMALLRRLPLQQHHMAHFDRDGLTGGECLGKHLLVIGVGRIGAEIVRIARGLGFAVKGVDIVPNKPDVEYVAKEDGLRWADVVVCAMNLTPENTGYFRYPTLQLMKPGCTFVNIARGEQSPLHDLLRAVNGNHLGGVGLDVYEEEGLIASALRSGGEPSKALVRAVQTLNNLPNVILTPHNAFNTQEAIRRKSEYTVRQVYHFLQHHDFIWKL